METGAAIKLKLEGVIFFGRTVGFALNSTQGVRIFVGLGVGRDGFNLAFGQFFTIHEHAGFILAGVSRFGLLSQNGTGNEEGETPERAP